MTNLQKMLRFLDGEISGLQARMSSYGNSAQTAKLAMLKDIRALVASLDDRRASA
ncbi:hypothetical protein [Shinella granuli]|uniref:Uncharacterized protein n=2 Tax=Shinella granuli TaxID=323621 RepID=A0A4R2BR88_SHIGR|nr:hypothetical protein [Shinella granuli]TCN29233.1 hypothetical protein EV665_1804 [Shinella granuli]